MSTEDVSPGREGSCVVGSGVGLDLTTPERDSPWLDWKAERGSLETPWASRMEGAGEEGSPTLLTGALKGRRK